MIQIVILVLISCLLFLFKSDLDNHHLEEDS